jgi:hypothetical protein
MSNDIAEIFVPLFVSRLTRQPSEDIFCSRVSGLISLYPSLGHWASAPSSEPQLTTTLRLFLCWGEQAMAKFKAQWLT